MFYDKISIILSIISIVMSAISLLIGMYFSSFIIRIYDIIESNKKDFYLLVIINSGFTPGILYPSFGIVYKNGARKKYIALHAHNIKIEWKYWNGGIPYTIPAKDYVFLYVSKDELNSAIQKIMVDGTKKIQFYVKYIPSKGKKYKDCYSKKYPLNQRPQ